MALDDADKAWLNQKLDPLVRDMDILKRETGSLRRDMRELKEYVMGPVAQALTALLSAHPQLKSPFKPRRSLHEAEKDQRAQA